MNRAEVIELLTNTLATAEVEEQEVWGPDDNMAVTTLKVLVTATGRPIMEIGLGATMLRTGAADLVAFVTDLLLDQIPCGWCNPNLEARSTHLLAACEEHRECQ